MAIKGFENFKKPVNDLERVYKEVEYKLSHGEEPKVTEVRKWFIYYVEKYYNTKMLGTQVNYCIKTLNNVKTKYNLCNFELCKKLIQWIDDFDKLGYRKENEIFDFSSLNKDWLIDSLNSKTPNYNKPKTTYLNDNTNNIDTKNRRI